jgi:hypothetical protein
MASDRTSTERIPARTWLLAAVAVVVRPWLWATALRQLLRVARRGWWRRPPFLPVPDPGYVGFRLETAYGPNAAPAAADLVAYLEWCRNRRR